MDTVLGRDSSRQQSSAARRADRCGYEEILEAYTGFRNTIDSRSSNLVIAIAAGGPDALVISKNADDVWWFL